MTDSTELVAQHAELIGRVALMWADVHRIMGQLFEDFSVSEEARQRYQATPSDRVQRQLVLSVGSVALQQFPDLRNILETTIKQVDALAGDRNAAIHTYWVIDYEGKIRANRDFPSHKRVRDDFEMQFKQLLGALAGCHLTLFNLRVNYFDRTARQGIGLPVAGL